MARLDNTLRGMARGPKYRTSCDSCQAAKVKCGHEKPSCRRCSVQKLECVYGISRRMGRPRAKNSAAEESSRAQANVGSDDNIRSKPATLAAAFADADTIAVRQTPAPEAGTGGLSLLESNQRPHPWTPTMAEIGRPNGNEIVDDTSMQSTANSLDFLPTDTPMELDDITSFPLMPSFLEDLPSSVESHRPMSSPSADPFDPQDLLSTRLSMTNVKGPFGSIDSQTSSRQRHSNDISALCLVQHSERFSHTDSTPRSSDAAPVSQRFDYSFDFLADLDVTSLDTGSTTSSEASRLGGAPACSVPIATPRLSASHVGCDLDSRSASGRRAPAEQKRAQCNCISAILGCIVSLKMEHLKTSSLPIDGALMRENEVEESLSRLHQCKNCCQESTVHLLALVSVQLMLDVLQKTAREEFLSRPRLSSSLADNSVLFIGSFKVTPRARFRFLRKLLQARFYRLALLLEEREKLVNGIRQDSFSRSASVLLGDISRGLRTIMGRVELWNLKHS
ncbi:hypothetical protein DL767_010631 [Monosporascus sp. MG133]|nr:hypothetical protein DL767_010631 [Monosporascus sp. MG133]